MTRDELKRLIKGPLATIPTAFDAKYKLDLGVMADLSRWWVEQGLVAGRTVIKVAAAMGEGPDLADDEWPHLLRTVVNAAGPQAAIVCALKPKNTLHTIEDAKKAQDLGAIGLQIDLPFFHHPTQDDMLRFFTDVSDAIDIGIMIYNTWWFGAPSLTAQTMLRLADAEHVVALKWSVPADQDYDSMTEFSHIFNIIDNSGQYTRCYQNGGQGFISAVAAAYPSHVLQVADLFAAGRYAEAEAEVERVEKSLGPFATRAAQRSGGYRVLKGMMAVIGHPVGPPRPPTLALQDDELAELKTLMQSWRMPGLV